MKVLLVRHAPAGDRAAFAKTRRPDSSRPLTSRGRRRMERAAKGLARILPAPVLVATSPLRRAVETGRILRRAYGSRKSLTLRELSPGARPQALLKRLVSLPDGATPVLVGHEPHLETVIDYLTTGGRGLRLPLKKGGACLLELSKPPRPGGAAVLWALAPAHLRRLGG